MRLGLLIVVVFCSFAFSEAQVVIYNNGLSITNTAENIYIHGSVTHQNNSLIVNQDSIYIDGDITNNGNLAFSDSSAGIFFLNGNTQLVGGSQSSDFYKLHLSCSDTLLLNQSVRVLDTLNFNTGYLNLNGQILDLSSSGTLTNERHGSHAFGVTGKIVATRTISSPSITDNIAGLGLQLASGNNPGITRVERTHAQQAAADSSIYRSFKIVSQNSVILDSLTLSYFTDEIVGNETNYKIFARNADLTQGWQNKNGTVDFVNKNVSSSLSLAIDSILLTVADQNCKTIPDINITGLGVY